MARCDREGEAVLHTIPPDALFLFGSKRSWVFPESAAEQEESRSENPRYTMAKYEGLRSLIGPRQEARGEVFFLKPPGFKYSGDLFHGDPEAYQRTSAWLQGHLDPATDRHYSPLLLEIPPGGRTSSSPARRRTQAPSKQSRKTSRTGRTTTGR
ncbi:unnamed protein product [Prorocentrum cordatum]|uniref:Uncharacterized protein n=1 Tax=Prorocentrum cordatum TaxID=2364126 RepID=A0ABN9U4X2_9DINO|nr:unnamed protein product [Polarella glacialis]